MMHRRQSSAIQSLLLATNGIGDEGAGHVAELIKVRPLRTVYLGCNPIGPEGARTLAAILRGNRTLRTLDVVNTGIGDDGARELLRALAEDNTTLQHLYLSGKALTPAILPDVVAVLKRHRALRGLYLSVNAFGNDVELLGEAVARNRALTSLGLASCDLDDTP